MKPNLQSVPGDKTQGLDHLPMHVITGRDCKEYHKLKPPVFKEQLISMKNPNILKFLLERLF